MADFVANLPASAFAGLVAPIDEYERTFQRSPGALGQRQCDAMLLAATAVLPLASVVARWIGRYGIELGNSAGVSVRRLLMKCLRIRDREWLVELVLRLARLNRISADQLWLVSALSHEVGMLLPATDSVVVAWARGGVPESGAAWDPILLRTFSTAGAGRYFVRQSGKGLADAVMEAIAAGRFSRDDVIDRCATALGRRFRAGDIRGYLAMYTQLDLTPREVADRPAAFVQLLDGGYERVAALAQSELIRAEEAGLLGTDWVLDATRAVFRRGDRRMTHVQFTWLESMLVRSPGAADAVVQAVQPLSEHHDEDISKAAEALAMRHDYLRQGILAAVGKTDDEKDQSVDHQV
ncbi:MULTISPECIES: hypothetical protein [Amycolatopsis]|uniref:hypothetical protein n=1 Tax=Amycolatopsis TaxID=1813 RepID=UPI00332B20D3